MSDSGEKPDTSLDRAIDRLVRAASQLDEKSFTRPADETIQTYLLGTATFDQKKEIRNALLQSATFRREIHNMAEDLEVVEDPETLKKLSRIDTASAPDLSLIAKSRLVVRVGELAETTRSMAEKVADRIRGILDGLTQAGAIPLELAPVGVTTLRGGGAGSLEGVPDVWNHVRRAITKGDTALCRIPEIGNLTIRVDIPTKTLRMQLYQEETTSETSETWQPIGGLEIWRTAGGSLELVDKIDTSSGEASIPLDVVEAGLMFCWVRAE